MILRERKFPCFEVVLDREKKLLRNVLDHTWVDGFKNMFTKERETAKSRKKIDKRFIFIFAFPQLLPMMIGLFYALHMSLLSNCNEMDIKIQMVNIYLSMVSFKDFKLNVILIFLCLLLIFLCFSLHSGSLFRFN